MCVGLTSESLGKMRQIGLFLLNHTVQCGYIPKLTSLCTTALV